MVFFWRILFSIALVVTAGAAEVPSCRAMKQSMTQCNPYNTSFLKMTALKRGAAFLRRRPITEKNLPTVEKLRLKNGMTLHGFIGKYINREERLYYKTEKKKPESAKREIEKEIEKPVSPKIPKTIVLTPEPEPPSVPQKSEERSDNRKLQPPKEVILPAEPLPDSKEKDVDINQDLKVEYAVYRVKKGDSLLGIAKQFGVETEILMKINKLRKDTRLREGQKLHIPLSQEDVDAIDNATYIVKRGDTLSRIAKHFHVTVKDLKRYNKIRKKSVIHVGQILVLPLPKKLIELKRIEERKRQIALKKKRERERLARIALKKAERKRFLRISRGLKRKLSVTATAYTSHRSQTDKTPFLAAWNNRIRPGMKIIAVSRDLIYRYGLTNGKKVRISGLKGIYTVRDKMNKKWRRRIDIYMGTSRWRALRWGRRRVTLYY